MNLSRKKSELIFSLPSNTKPVHIIYALGVYRLGLDRITATAYNRMLFWQPQPRCGCEYDIRNRGYFFNNREYFKKFLYNKLFHVC